MPLDVQFHVNGARAVFQRYTDSSWYRSRTSESAAANEAVGWNRAEPSRAGTSNVCSDFSCGGVSQFRTETNTDDGSCGEKEAAAPPLRRVKRRGTEGAGGFKVPVVKEKEEAHDSTCIGGVSNEEDLLNVWGWSENVLDENASEMVLNI